MNFFDWIRAWFNYATQVFVYLALESYSSWYIPDAMGDFFNYLSDWTASVSGYLYDASSWYDDVAARLHDVLSWSTIWDYILSYVPNLMQIRDWFYSVTSNVLSVVATWWSSTQWTVRGWISVATNNWELLLGQVNAGLANLQADWESFRGRIPVIDQVVNWWSNWPGEIRSAIDTWWASTMGDVRELIDNAFQVRNSLWSGWQEIRTDVLTFFQDPVEYIWERFTDWFLGPEA